MKLPWVSRELYNRVLSDLEKSEKAHQELLDSLHTEAPVEDVKSEDVVDPITGRLDADKLRRMATKAAYQRAGIAAR